MKRLVLDDFDEFAGMVGGVDVSMLCQAPTRRRWVLEHIALPEVHIQRGFVGSGNIVEGSMTRDEYLIYLPLSDKVAYSANGTIIPKGSMMILEPGCEFRLSTRVEHDWCAISVPSQILCPDWTTEATSPNPNRTGCRLSARNRQQCQVLLDLLTRAFSAATDCPNFEKSPAATEAAKALHKIARAVVQGSQSGEHHEKGRPKLSRDEILRSCLGALESHMGEPVSLERLASATNVSQRTIRRVFNEYYGVGPVRYAQTRLLHKVRRVLETADPDATTVTHVLFDHGVWELSRFASRYRRLFGELPSETLLAKVPQNARRTPIGSSLGISQSAWEHLGD